MPGHFRAIHGKVPLLKADRQQFARTMVKFAGQAISDLSEYPRYSSPAYVRTGTLGRGWRYQLRRTRSDLVVEVINPVPYADYVMGPGQTRVMEAIGWPQAEEILDRVVRDMGGELRRTLGRQ